MTYPCLIHRNILSTSAKCIKTHTLYLQGRMRTKLSIAEHFKAKKKVFELFLIFYGCKLLFNVSPFLLANSQSAIQQNWHSIIYWCDVIFSTCKHMLCSFAIISCACNHSKCDIVQYSTIRIAASLWVSYQWKAVLWPLLKNRLRNKDWRISTICWFPALVEKLHSSRSIWFTQFHYTACIDVFLFRKVRSLIKSQEWKVSGKGNPASLSMQCLNQVLVLCIKPTWAWAKWLRPPWAISDLLLTHLF